MQRIGTNPEVIFIAMSIALLEFELPLDSILCGTGFAT
jgi:hypothetical protein